MHLHNKLFARPALHSDRFIQLSTLKCDATVTVGRDKEDC